MSIDHTFFGGILISLGGPFQMNFYYPLLSGIAVSFFSSLLSFCWLAITRPKYASHGGPASIGDGLSKLFFTEIICTGIVLFLNQSVFFDNDIITYLLYVVINVIVTFLCKFLQVLIIMRF